MALEDEYFTIAQAAKDLKVTRQTISRWITQHNIPIEKIGNVKLIKKEDIKYQRMRLSFAAADQILALIWQAYTDFCQKKGYISMVEVVKMIKPQQDHLEVLVENFEGVKRYIKISPDEQKRIHKRVTPKLAEFLKDLDLYIDKQLSQITIKNKKLNENKEIDQLKKA